MRRIIECTEAGVKTDNTLFSGFTVTGGNAADGGSDGYGGGMVIKDASPAVTNCTFSGNTARNFGGGMKITQGSLTMTKCTFAANSAENNGGGMYIYNVSPAVTNCTFAGNSANNGKGGGI